MHRLLAIVSIVLALSGCTSTDGVQGGLAARPSEASHANGPSLPTTPAAEPLPTEETGSIAGVVTDDELVGLRGATVVLREDQTRRTTTDPEGRFTLNEILPGTHDLLVDAPGYVSGGRSVDVVAGEVVEVRIALEAIRIEEVRNAAFIGDAYFGLAVSVPGLFHSNVAGDSKEDFSYPVDPDISAVVSAAQWQPNAALTAQHMQLQVYTDGTRTCSETRAVCAKGTSPVQVAWHTVQDLVKGRDGRSIGVSVMPVSCEATSCPSNPPQQLVQVAYDQRVKVYTTIFYTDPAPEGYSPLPPS